MPPSAKSSIPLTKPMSSGNGRADWLTRWSAGGPRFFVCAHSILLHTRLRESISKPRLIQRILDPRSDVLLHAALSRVQLV